MTCEPRHQHLRTALTTVANYELEENTIGPGSMPVGGLHLDASRNMCTLT